jgi:hypothetical protein
MPIDGQTKPCVRAGCTGTMTFSKNARPPGYRSGVPGKDNEINWPQLEQSGWECDREGSDKREHFEAEQP